MSSLQFAFRPGPTAAALSMALLAGACGGGALAIDRPRPLVVPSGARIQPDSVRLDSVDVWVQEMERTIAEDPSFWVIVDDVPQAGYPWENLEFQGEDTVRVAVRGAVDAQLSYMIYGYLHIMQRMGRLGEEFPDAAALEGFELERFILARTAESWLLGRSVYDMPPYRPLDELVYAQDRGHLDALILSARPEEFGDTREAWLEENPEGLEAFRSWFRETFDRDPPGPTGS